MIERLKVTFTLFCRELTSFFVSSMGWIILTVWLLTLGLMLGVFGGAYNLFDNGYASLRPMFELAPVLMILIVPAVTMRSFAEERRSGTYEWLVSHPVTSSQITTAKFFASWTVMALAVILTLLYILVLRMIALQGMDAGETAGGYIGMYLILAVFVSIGLCCSAFTKNQVTAYLSGVFLSFFFYYGFDLLASLTHNGALYARWEKLGMKAHYDSMTHGVLYGESILYLVLLGLIFRQVIIWQQTRIYCLGKWKKVPWLLCFFLVVYVGSSLYSVRMDLTEDKRFTLSPQTRNSLQKLQDSPEIILYLNGSLNPEFNRLRSATLDLLTEMANYTSKGMRVTLVDPSSNPDVQQREQRYAFLAERGITGLSVHHRDVSGKVTTQVLFPWAEIVSQGDTVPVPLLRRNAFRSSQEVFQTSFGELEYGFSDALRILTLKNPHKIAFIEGHGEMEEPELYETFNILSRYYQIDRGPLGEDPNVLAPYKTLVIADPKTPFSEQEKFVLDQFIMGGGSVFFLIRGAHFNPQEFERTGESPTLKVDLNLDDLLFTYGARIEPVTLQDLQCTSITLTTSSAASGTENQTTRLPWFFAPLLLPSGLHPVTTSVSPLQSEYVSPVVFVNPRPGVQKYVLFTTSDHTHSLTVPEKVSLRYVEMPASEQYFNESRQPVIVLMEGTFSSVFANRITPSGVRELSAGRLEQSEGSRILVAGTASILGNEWEGSGRNVRPVPLGYDRNSRTLLGNEEFLIQSLSYLTGDEEWLRMRGRVQPMRLLNPEATTLHRTFWQAILVGIPVAFLFIALFLFRQWRATRFFREKRRTH